ncbi:MAG: nodulation protein NodZ, partial [Thermodesulfobacteriota bacterium]
GELFRKFSIDLTKLDYQEDVLVMWTTHARLDLLKAHFKGEFKELSHMSRKAILSKLLREDLILHPEIQQRVNRFKENNFYKKTVGVHIRYADHRASLWATLKELNAMLNREPGLQIFLATDNIQIKNMFEESYEDVITTPHWYPEPGLRLHGNRNCPDLIESGVEALVDLYLLSECDYLIIDGSSSFSYLANLLAKAPEAHVFDVKKRGKLPRRRRKLSWWLMLKLGLFSWGLGILGKFVRIQKFLSR